MVVTKLGIGIDTGGTYTDAVIYDFESRKILAGAKALTTREDLERGILGAIDEMPPELLRRAEVVSLSTTLATNACVEDRVGRAKLIFFGGDPRVIDRYGGQYGLPPSSEMLIQDAYTKLNGAVEREPDWALFRSQLQTGFEDAAGVGILEMNAMKNGAVVEKQAKEIFQSRYDLPVVCGHELFSELNSLQRGASTLLNAGLFPVIGSFLKAIKAALRKRGVDAAVVVVRSDGSLMSEEFAAKRPVETLLCGPAASVLGGHALSGAEDCIVVDMGGTTTDIALVRSGRPVTVLDGIQIGRWKTFVDGLYVKTIGLGGDSAVHYKGKRLILEPYRVVPLCVAAGEHPVILEHLRALLKTKVRHTRFLHEQLLLMRDGDLPNGTEAERQLCRALRDGPLSLQEAAAAVGQDVYSLDVSRLVRDGVVQVCGLTPTDIMHLKGDFAAYDTEAASLAAAFVARNLGISVEALCEQVYGEIKRRIYCNVVEAVLENRYPRYQKHGVDEEIRRLIRESYDPARREENPFVSVRFETAFSLVGIGAPTHLFLPDVAAALGTGAVVPDYAGVANALGAVVGQIAATHRVEVRPGRSDGEPGGYTVYGNGESRSFQELEDAETYALREAEAGAREEAQRRGARGQIAVSASLERQEARAEYSDVYLGTTAVARAVGAAGF